MTPNSPKFVPIEPKVCVGMPGPWVGMRGHACGRVDMLGPRVGTRGYARAGVGTRGHLRVTQENFIIWFPVLLFDTVFLLKI